MYQVNDYVMYGMQGVCRVKDICEVDFGEEGTLYYELVTENDQRSEIFVNIKNGERKMRDLMPKEYAKKIMEGIKMIPDIWISNDKEREKAYKQAIFAGDYDEILQILKSLCKRRTVRLNQGKRQTELDERIYRNTKRILFGELSMVLDMDLKEVEREIIGQIEKTA